MSLTRRRSSARAAAKAAPPVVISLDSDDDEPAPSPSPSIPAMDEADVDPYFDDVLRPPATKNQTRTKSKSNGVSSLMVPTHTDNDSQNTLPLRRAATIPISQVHSGSTTTKSKKKAPKVTDDDDDDELALLLAEDADETDTPAMSQGALSLEPPPESEEEESEEEKATKTQSPPLARIKTSEPTISTMDRKPIPASMSTPSKLPSTMSASVKPEVKASSTSLFLARNYIDANLVKSTSTIEDMEDLTASGGDDPGQPTQSLRRSILMEVSSDSDSELEALFSGPTKKKHCGPGRRPQAKIEKQPKAPNGRTFQAHADAPVVVLDGGAVSVPDIAEVEPANYQHPKHAEAEDPEKQEKQGDEDVEKPVAAKAAKASPPKASATNKKPSTAKEPAKKPEVVRTSSANADLLLEEILGPDLQSAALSGQGRKYADYAAMQLSTPTAQTVSRDMAAARQYLELSRTRETFRVDNPAQRPGRAATATGTIKVQLVMGSRKTEMTVSPSNTFAQLLGAWEKADLLPMLLPNQTYFLKFDEVPMSPEGTIASSLIANGEQLVLCARRSDGTEYVGAFDDDTVEPVVDTNRIRLKVRLPDGTVGKYRIGRDEPLSKLADAVARKLGVAKVKLKFDDEYVSLEDSPEEQGELEDDDMLDATIPK